MKILMVSETYYPLVGGIPDHISHLAEELRKMGNIVKIVTAKFARDKIEDEEVIRIGRGIPIRANKSFSRLTLGWRPSNKIKRLLLNYRPDIVHIHGSLAPMLPVLALRHSKAINVITFHAGHRKSIGYSMFRPLLMPYFRKLHGIIAVSKTAECAMNKYFKGDYKIIPNGIDTNGFSPAVEPLSQYTDNRKKILYMNRLEPKKGLPHLLRALKYIKREIKDVLLIVAGPGPFAHYYKNLVDDATAGNVIFVGKIPGRPVSLRATYYRTCDLFCAPSIGHESFGIVLLEAMASEKPVVASDIDGYRHVLEHGVEGLLCHRKDAKNLAEAILTILRDSDLAEKMGKAGRRKALLYSWPKIAKQIESFYKGIYTKENALKLTKNMCA